MEKQDSLPQEENAMATEKKVLTSNEYTAICEFIGIYQNLAVECELALFASFPDINRLTIKSILQNVESNRMRGNHWRYEAIGKKYIQLFDDENAENREFSSMILVNVAITEGVTPVTLCRAVLQERYQNKVQIARMIKYPHLIDDALLSANVIQCLCSDNQVGPLMDMRSRFVGEEYEFKLKQLANAAGMHFHDENDLRRLGYDKTPDIKLIVPFLYKGEVINWIESKAQFGDPKTHKRHIYHQLNSYNNRFGSGMIIYWFGYHKETPQLLANGMGITVLDDFPAAEHLTFLKFEQPKEPMQESTKTTTTPTTSNINDDDDNRKIKRNISTGTFSKVDNGDRHKTRRTKSLANMSLFSTVDGN